MSNNPELHERLLVQARLDGMSARLSQVRAEQDADLEALRETWRTTAHQELADHAKRMDAIKAEHDQHMKVLTGQADAPGPELDVAQQAHMRDVPPSGARAPAPSDGIGPAEQPTLTEVDLANMSMAEYAARRAKFGVRSPESMSHLFGRSR